MTLPYSGNIVAGLVVTPFEGIFRPEAFTSPHYAEAATQKDDPKPTVVRIGAAATTEYFDRLDSSLDHIM